MTDGSFPGAVTEENSVLRYGPREGPSDYAHPEFTPLFLDEMTAAQRQAGQNVCGAGDKACIYDYVVSGSESFALRTKQARETALKDNADISELQTLSFSLSLSLARSLDWSLDCSLARFFSVCLLLSLSLCLSLFTISLSGPCV